METAARLQESCGDILSGAKDIQRPAPPSAAAGYGNYRFVMGFNGSLILLGAAGSLLDILYFP